MKKLDRKRMPLSGGQSLDSFFQIQYRASEKKQYFIYNGVDAHFANSVQPNDQFVVSRLGVKLFVRNSKTPDSAPDLPQIQCGQECEQEIPLRSEIPLMKSNLQKAVRRRNAVAALTSAAAMQLSPNAVELVRRIPIIMVEDVCVSRYIVPIVWFLVADKAYTLSLNDKWLLLEAVYEMCRCKTWYEYELFTASSTIVEPYSVAAIQEKYADLDQFDVLMALHLRSMYGGMPVDIVMLNNTIEYYISNHPMVPPAIGDYERLEVRRAIASILSEAGKVKVLEAAIDFHPFPKLLRLLAKITELDENTIHELIWCVESAVNVRKPRTLIAAERAAATEDWRKIERSLSWARKDSTRRGEVSFGKQMICPIEKCK